jgi:phospholipid/cholesterol/gamma-HCH transport system substrate-binding protein
VQISGINVGHIVSRELMGRPPEGRDDLVRDKRFAKISVALDKKKVMLYGNAVIYKRSASLLGEFYLEIDPGTYKWTDEKGVVHEGMQLRNGSEIRYVGEAATAGSVIQQISGVIPVLKGLMNDMRAFTKGPLTNIGKNLDEGISENRKSLREMIRNLELISSDVRSVTRGSGGDVQRIIADIKDITGNLKTALGDSQLSSHNKKIASGLDKINASLDKLDLAMGDTKDITGNIKGITDGLKEGKGTLGRLLTDDNLINDVEETVREAGDFVKGLTGLQTYVGLRSEYNFQAGSIKTYLTVELRPRPDKYYVIELIDDPRGRRNVTTTLLRSNDPSKPQLTREERIEISDAFRISFQFAKRISFATFRFGIKESTGGIGVDLRWKTLSLHTDIFDFQANIWPRLKVMAAWQFFRRLYVVGGIDDAFNERPENGTGGGRDFFVGAQLRFNDEDLKQLLLFGGSAVSGISN